MCFEWKRQNAKLPVQEAQNRQIGLKTYLRLLRTHHIPQARHAQIAPDTIQFAFLVKAPDRQASFGHLITTYFVNVFSVVAEPEDSPPIEHDKTNVDQTYPVANITTSAGSSLPSSKERPVSVNSLI